LLSRPLSLRPPFALPLPRAGTTRHRFELEAFRFVFRDSRLTITDVNTRFLRPDVAVVHVRWTMTGAKTPPGLPEPRQGIQTLTFTKQQGQWLIAALQNTLSVPEQPFTPPTSEAKLKQR
jgi:uncharacterized protein (TIGR02246 family)